MIAVTGEAEVGPVRRCASAIVTAWARIATRTLRLRSPDVVAGVKAPIGRPPNVMAVGRFALIL